MKRYALSILVLAIASTACDRNDSSRDGGPSYADVPMRVCSDDGECDDRIDCTVDTCERGACSNLRDDSLCDDGIFCNGDEQCDSSEGCIPDFRAACDDGDPCTVDRCEESSKACSRSTRDLDGDGDIDLFCSGGDCDDLDAARSSQAPELCNELIDNDCDGLIDETNCGRIPHDVCADALDVSAGGLFTLSTLGAAGDYPTSCGAGTPGDIVATFVLTEPSDVSISADAGLNTTTLSLRRSCEVISTELECRTNVVSRVRARALPSGRYFLVASASSGTDIALDVEIDSPTDRPVNDLCADAIPIEPGMTADVSLVDLGDDLRLACGQADSGDVFYSFSLEEEQNVRIQVSTESGQSVYWQLATTCDASNPLRCSLGGPATASMYGVAPGDYVLAVEGPANREVDARVLVELSPPTDPPVGDRCSGAIPLPLESRIVGGNLAGLQDDVQISCSSWARDAVYIVETLRPGDLVVDVQPNRPTSANVSIRTECEMVSSEETCVTFSEPHAVARNVPAGRYFVIVEGAEPYAFAIEASLRDPTLETPVAGNDACATAYVVGSGGGVFTGSTSLQNDTFSPRCATTRGRPDAAFEITVQSQTRIVANTQGSAFDTVLALVRGTCDAPTELVCNTNDGAQITSAIDVTVDSGTYVLFVDGNTEAAEGDYRLDIDLISSAP